MASKLSRRFRAGTRVSLALISLTVAAAAVADNDVDTGPGRFQFALTTALSHTDNYYYSSSNEQSVTAAWLRPEFRFTAQNDQAALKLDGSAEYLTSTAPGSKDDYLDRRIGLSLGLTPTYRNRFFVDGGFKHGHDPFGTLRTAGTSTFTMDLDQWNRGDAGVTYRYGAPDARVNAEIGASLFNVNYTTNPSATQFLDYKIKTVNYNLIYNATPKTSAVLSFMRSAIDFDLPFDANGDQIANDGLDLRSGDLYQIRAGIRWLATAKTSGDVRGGYRQRTFKNLPDQLEGFDWQASVDWTPLVPLLIRLQTARSEDESYLAANTIDTRSNSISFRGVVNQRSALTLDFGQSHQDFFGIGRRDQNRSGSLGLEYTAASNIALVGNIGYGMRASNDPSVDYHRMSAFIGVRLGRLR